MRGSSAAMAAKGDFTGNGEPVPPKPDDSHGDRVTDLVLLRRPWPTLTGLLGR